MKSIRDYDVSAEHAPMTVLAELPVNQWTPQTMIMQSSSDPRSYERYWFTAQDKTGDLFVVCGWAIYPVLGTVEAYAIVNLRGQHTTVRAHRRLTSNRLDMRVGPLNFELIEGLKEWRLTLDENEYGISYDMSWFDTKRAIMQPAHLGGYETFGYPSGTVTVQGETFELTQGTYTGSRDHHWGIRNSVGGPGHAVGEARTATATAGQWVEFGDWSIWMNRSFLNLGDARGGTDLYHKLEVAVSFDDNHMFTGAVTRNTLQGGEVKELHFRPLNNQAAFLRCGMYGGSEGGTPDGDIWMGMYVGDNVVSGETYDITDPAMRLKLRGGTNYHCEVTCGDEVAYGIFETHDPVTWEMCESGAPGYSLLG